MIKAVTYFNFENSLEALEYYKNNFNAEVVTRTMGNDPIFRDMPDEYKMPEEVAKKFVMNAEFNILGKTFMVSDTMGNEPINNEGVNVCFTFDGDNDVERERITEFFYKAIERGCEEVMPLDKTEWTDLYGMFKDPFGITWMVSAVYEEIQ